jgi:diguanylate cyclase (GGDEF)-like protein
MNINLSTADTDSLTDLLNDNINKLRHLSDERINITDMHEQMLSNLTVIEHKVSEVKKEANTLKNTIHEIANKSKCDPLTRLLNINSFSQNIDDCMKMLNEQQLHVFIADIDNFGDINKEYNTAVGDKILKVLAITMRKVLPPEIIIARLAGAHFGIIIQNADQKKTSAILEKLIACVKAIPFHYRNTKVDVSISVTGFQVTTPMQPTQVISKLENYVTQTKDHEGKVITRSHLHIIPQ